MQPSSSNILCHYFGPITAPGRPSIGGFEAANRKNIDALRANGVEVVEHPNPVKPNHKLGALVYAKLLFTPFLLFKDTFRRNKVLHITPLARGFIYLGALCIGIAKLLGFKTVLDIRAGNFIKIYDERSNFYRKVVDFLARHVSAITVEGQAYIPFFENIVKGKVPVVYFPNTINDGMVGEPNGERSHNVFYFGRVTSNKGIDKMLDAIKILGEPYRLFIAGGIAPDIDSEMLKTARVEYLGLLTPADLKKQMAKMGYFIFPSTHYGEGQSNSLIEAMGNGLVPIASANGFTADVVGDCGAVLPLNAAGRDYAEAILHVARNGFEKYSRDARERILRNHNLDIEIKKLINLYHQILCH